MTFEGLLRKPDQSKTEQTLIQSIAALSSHPNYQKMTPWEIYDEMAKMAKIAAKIAAKSNY